MKLQKLIACLAAWLILLSCVSCRPLSEIEPTADAQGSTPLLYKVTDSDGDEIWLFGSIHVGTENMYPLPAYVTDAYEQSEGLAVECDVEAAENDLTLMSSLLQKMLYLDGTTIADHIPAELYEDAVAILRENDSYAEPMEYYTPVLWSSIIDSLANIQHGYDAEMGIDLHLLSQAKTEGKPIYEIESVEAQYDMLASFSEELQLMLLESSVEGYRLPGSKLMMVTLVNAWTEGNEARLSALLQSDTSSLSDAEQALYEDYNQAMMTDRNLLMADFAEDALQDGNELFICVGAAHVIGEDGIAAQLREKKGYTVETVQ